MAMIYYGDFDKYATIAEWRTDNDFTGGGSALQAGAGRFGGDVLRTTSAANSQTFPLVSIISGTTLIIQGTWILTLGISSNAATNLIQVTNALSGLHFRLVWSPGGYLHVVNAAVATVATSPPDVIRPGVHHYVEVKVNLANAGSCIVKIDGIEVINVSGDFFGTGVIQLVSIIGVAGTTDIEDLIIMDGSGSVLNDFLGELRMDSQVVDADGAVAAWTPSAGSNFQCIDDALGAYDDDTTTIESNTLTQVNLASHATIVAANHTVIPFVGLSVLARDATTTTDEITLEVISAGDTAASGNKALEATYRWRSQAFAVDPDTGAAWTLSAINAAEYGVVKAV